MGKELIIYYTYSVEVILNQSASMKMDGIGRNEEEAIESTHRRLRRNEGWQNIYFGKVELIDVAFAINKDTGDLLDQASLDELKDSLVTVWVGGKKTLLESFDENELKK